jgi:hypothetical protein
VCSSSECTEIIRRIIDHGLAATPAQARAVVAQAIAEGRALQLLSDLGY